MAGLTVIASTVRFGGLRLEDVEVVDVERAVPLHDRQVVVRVVDLPQRRGVKVVGATDEERGARERQHHRRQAEESHSRTRCVSRVMSVSLPLSRSAARMRRQRRRRNVIARPAAGRGDRDDGSIAARLLLVAGDSSGRPRPGGAADPPEDRLQPVRSRACGDITRVRRALMARVGISARGAPVVQRTTRQAAASRGAATASDGRAAAARPG